MNTTKIYVIISETRYSPGSTLEIVLSFLNREDAEFEIWKLKNNKVNSFNSGGKHFSIETVEVKTQDRTTKEFKSFAEYRVKELQSNLDKSRDCRDKDIENIKTATDEIENYKKLL